MSDSDWTVLRAVVERGLRDAGLMDDPPHLTEEELGFVADTVTDNLAAALASGVLVKRAAWWRRR